jgi:hypothetical protein
MENYNDGVAAAKKKKGPQKRQPSAGGVLAGDGRMTDGLFVKSEPHKISSVRVLCTQAIK